MTSKIENPNSELKFNENIQTIDRKKEAALYAQKYAKLGIRGNHYLGFRDLKSLIEKYVRGKETLDYGCGFGRSTKFLRDLGLNVTGVDSNEHMIESALQNDVDGSYTLIKSGNIPASDASYDLVFSSWVMMELSTKSELMEIGKEIGRVLKPGGIFMMIVCNRNTYDNKDWLTENTEFEENRELYSGRHVKILFKDINVSISCRFWTEDDYREMIKGAGMELLEMHNPLGKDSDGIDWKLERKLAPSTIYIARKISDLG